MKKLLSTTLILMLLFTMPFAVACDAKEDLPAEESTAEEPSYPQVERWLVNELHYVSSQMYDDPVNTVEMTAIFTNQTTGTKLRIPAFWNGGTDWVVRFALTEEGVWSVLTQCSDESNDGLCDKTSKIKCVAYSGDLYVYKHGFVKTEEGKRYFVYDDGTPFFYLGDTHWTLPVEEIDGIGDVSQEKADKYEISSQFKTIMDYRKEQGFTVIQSQPLGWYTGKTGNSWFGDASGSVWDYGINADILAKLQQYDQYFAYIAQLGLVHSNATWSYPEELIETYLEGKISKSQIENLTRYWVARYGAYPVMWSTVQEGDDDYYEYGGCTAQNNPWLIVMNALSEYDAYDHPTTCHQENASSIDNSTSPFVSSAEHDWYATQYSVDISDGGNVHWNYMKYYYNSGKPSVNYEGSYAHFWTGDLGNRAQAWTTYLNGMVGYGYGVQPIWSIVWAAYGEHTDTSNSRETYNRDDDWIDGLYSDTGKQMVYLKNLLEKYEWWKLVPCFNRSIYFNNIGVSNYSVATIENDLYIAYFWGNNNSRWLGSFINMENGSYRIQWFNCRTGEIESSYDTDISNGSFAISAKPDSNDWVLIAERVK